jgi:TetR/AcrR family transcriptional regulator
MTQAQTTRDRVLDEALIAFAREGYGATSLDALAAELGVRKQTILYYFPSKEDLLNAVVDRSAAELAEAFERSLLRAGSGWDRVEAVVNSVFRLAARRPEVVAVVREVSRLGPPASTRYMALIEPLVERATAFLEEEMAAGHLRQHDARLVLLLAYAAVVAMTTEVDALRALGMPPTARSLLKRRGELLAFFHSALAPVR